jgi:5'(3')-deoxyribonucleotidase
MNSTDKIATEMVEPAPFPLDILYDLDGITANLHTPWFALYNKDWSDHLTVENLTTFEIDQIVKKDCGRDIYKYLTPELYESLRPIVGAAEAIRHLRRKKHNVKACTAAASDPDTAAAKLKWIKKTIGVGRREVFVCHDKDWIPAHVFIEDSPDNLKKYKIRNPNAVTMMIEYPYNKSAVAEGWVDFNAGSYRQPQVAWDRIVEKIDAISQERAALQRRRPDLPRFDPDLF